VSAIKQFVVSTAYNNQVGVMGYLSSLLQSISKDPRALPSYAKALANEKVFVPSAIQTFSSIRLIVVIHQLCEKSQCA
jgi:hypothetical protein